jgi:hypothetical protein
MEAIGRERQLKWTFLVCSSKGLAMTDSNRAGVGGVIKLRTPAVDGKAFVRMVMLLLGLTLAGMSAVADVIFVDRFRVPPVIEVSADSVQSLDRVDITAWPADWTGLEQAEIEFVNVPGSGTLVVEQDEAGWYFLAPFHPVTPELGGLVQIRARLGGLTSAVVHLDVLALPDAPGAFDALVASLEAHINAFAQRRGSSFETIAALSFAEAPTALFPLKYAQSFVRDSENPNSLAALFDTDSSFLSAGERRFLDQIAGHIDLKNLVDLEVAALAELEMTGAIGAAGSYQASVNSLGTLSGAARSCIDAGPEINSAFELSNAMWEAKFGAIAVSGAPGRTLNTLGATFAAGSALPVYGSAFLAGGAATAAWQASRNALAGLNPSRFESITAAVSRSRFEEDSEAFGSYDSVVVVAASNGWTVDQAILDAVTTLLSASTSVGKLAKIREADFLTDLSVNVINFGMSNYVGAQPGGVVSFCPRNWSVDISSSLYNEGRSVLGNFEVRTNQKTFRPVQVAEDFLSIAAIPAKFGQETIDVDFPIGVDPIEVTAAPRTIRVSDPGEIVDITATIENAELTTLDWDAGPGRWTDGLSSLTNDGGTRPLQTPSARDDFPFQVKIESFSRQGLRASGQPERSDSVLIELSELVVTPGSVCLKPGQSRQFSAIVDDAPADVTWSLQDSDGQPSSLGTVSSTGLYTAPGAGSGRVLVVATTVDDPPARDFGIVEVGNCICYWALNIAGEGAWSGDEAGHTFFLSIAPFEPGYRLAFFSDAPGGGLAESANASIDENVTGLFDLGRFSFSSGPRLWSVFPPDPDSDNFGTSAKLRIDENIDNTSMTGSIFGTAAELYNDGDGIKARLRNFDMNFRSAGLEGSCEEEF